MAKPLVGQRSRQAAPLFKGVNHQLWRSILAWIDLEENCALWIEGAEDFDIVGTGHDISVQIKATEAAISLRSESVVDALNNFWRLREANPGRSVQLHFLTTSEAAKEAGGHFNGTPGLPFWNSTAKTGGLEGVQELQLFLLNELKTRLDGSFLRFIESSNSIVLRELIQKITWQLASEDTHTVREMVRVRLHAYAESKALSIHDADMVLPVLFDHVARKAAKESQSLTREDFRLIFDQSTRESVPKAELAVLRQSAFAMRDSMITPAVIANERNQYVFFDLPPLPSPCCVRRIFIQQIHNVLKSISVLFVSGSTGTGKTTAAKLVAAENKQKWIVVEGDATNLASFTSRLRAAVDHVTRVKETVSLLIDDLRIDQKRVEQIAQYLRATTQIVVSRGGYVVFTSVYSMRGKFRREMNLPENAYVTVPRLSESEIDDLCQLAGCVDDNKRKFWARFILVQSGGHPQLVHATVAVTKRNGWPGIVRNAILAIPSEIKEEQRRSRLLLGLESEDTELLYRLSVASGSFRRDHAVAIAEIEPRILNAGDRFDQLVGPWIEPGPSKYFRISPLLKDAGQENWTSEATARMRGKFARVLMKCGDMTTLEASEVLTQAILISDHEVAAPILVRLLQVSRRNEADAASQFEWLLLLPPRKQAFSNAFCENLLRDVQFRFASAINHEYAPLFGEALYISSRASFRPEIDAVIKSSASMRLLTSQRVLLPPKLLIRAWLDFDLLAETSPEVQATAIKFLERRAKRLKLTNGIGHILFSFVLSRPPTSESVFTTLQVLNDLADVERERVLRAIKSNKGHFQNWLDRLWFSETDKKNPQWQPVIGALEAVWRFGIRWAQPEFVASSARGIAVIQSEYLKNDALALATLKSARDACPRDAAILHYQRAAILAKRGHTQEAYDEWRSALRDWEVDDFELALLAIHGHSHCAESASRLGLWSEAAEIFGAGRELAIRLHEKIEALAFEGDRAYALWRGGCRTEAIAVFLESLRKLESTVPKQRNSLRFRTIRKMFEHVITWCAGDAGFRTQTVIELPPPAIFSTAKTEKQEEMISSLPQGPYCTSFFILAEAELLIGNQDKCFQAAIGRDDLKFFPTVAVLIRYLAVKRTFKQRSFDHLVQLIEQAGLAFATAKANGHVFPTVRVENPVAPTCYISEVQFLAGEALISAIVVCVANGTDIFSIIQRWKTAAHETKSGFDWQKMLSIAEDVLRCCSIEAYHHYKEAEGDRFRRQLAALRMGVDGDSDLAACFVGLSTLVSDDSLFSHQFGGDEAIGNLVRKVWLNRLKFPIEFGAQSVTVPIIQKACDSDAKGRKLAAMILFNASSAVSVRSVGETVAKLRNLSEG